jgi:aryl-alcohol dehydrogenase-like predicted oxidoreductase
VKYRRIPGTDLHVSVVGFGCWAMGGKWWGDDVDDADSTRAIEAALELGINLFDTAPLYGYGHADEVLRDALGPRRHDVVIATKVGVRWGGEGEHARSDLDPAWVRDDTEASLLRLGLETIPLLQVHWPDEGDVPLDDTLDALVRLRDDGKIRQFGLCNYPAEPLRAAVEEAGCVSLQTPFSLVRREFESSLAPTFASALRDRAGVLAYEPLCRGLLTGKFDSPPHFPETDLRARDDRFRPRAFRRIRRLVQGLDTLARHFDSTPAAVAVAWVLRHPAVTAALTGAKRPAQIRENADAARLIDDAEFPWEVVDQMVHATRV